MLGQSGIFESVFGSGTLIKLNDKNRKSQKLINEMTTFWATMLLRTSKRQDFLYSKNCGNYGLNLDLFEDPKLFQSRTGSGINSFGSTTLVYHHFLWRYSKMDLVEKKQ
jgi:hypothetical protein